MRGGRKLSYVIKLEGICVGFVEITSPIGRWRKQLKTEEVIEISRVFLVDGAPKNSESCAISKVLRRIKTDWQIMFGVKPKLVISYADPAQGHQGTIYRALGFTPFSPQDYKVSDHRHDRSKRIKCHKIRFERSLEV